tara:strand:- start:3660 stop:3977 length:318 start_codon:yes stop_codon:yes gene_type:complete
MGKFTSATAPRGGRKHGSKNKRQAITPEMESKAKDVLLQALNNCEQWACESVLKRVSPPLKAVTPENSLDGEYLRLKSIEISEFDERLKALEEQQHEQQKQSKTS